MYDIVKIGDKDIPMLAMASVDIYYKNIFGIDPLTVQTKEDPPISEVIELFQQMGFVMAKFAETKNRKEMLKLNEEAFIDWVEQFDRADLIKALPDIRAVYDGEPAYRTYLITRGSERADKYFIMPFGSYWHRISIARNIILNDYAV